VRDASGLPLRKAFEKRVGPLTDILLVEGEQQAMSDLFAGAIELFKNPASHRANTVKIPEKAASLVMFANLLLTIVDERSVRRPSATTT
jgi:Protein of unknown function (Hypoth_ymh)